MNLRRLEVENHRGRRVPQVLGLVLGAAAVVGSGIGAWILGDPSLQWGIGGACVLVGLAGLVDDLATDGPRGLRGHLRELASGRMSTGILKLIVSVGSAVLVVGLLRSDGVEAVAAVVLIAGSANIWNGLDVRPGRALKGLSIVVGMTLLFSGKVVVGGPTGVWLGGLFVLPLDLRERAMLGDSGSNLAGFAAGVSLAATMPGWAILASSVAVVGLNILAETVSFSRVIDAVAPLRWFDRVGRVSA